MEEKIISPVLGKDALRYMTKVMSPDQVQYVTDIRDIRQECEEICDKCNMAKCDDCQCEDSDHECKCKECGDECQKGCCYDAECLASDIIYVSKIMAFADKFRVLHWTAVNMSYHKAIDEFCGELEKYKDAIAENIQAIIGQFENAQFRKLELPLDDNPLGVINELKQCCQNFLELHAEDAEYEGCRNATSGFLETIYSYIYQFRLCKD